MGIELDPAPLFQEFAHPEKFVSASWLSARLGARGLTVVESDGDAFLYDIGHIPGAVRIDWHRDLNDLVRRDFIDGASFARLMSERGISREDTVVVYGDSANCWAAYTAWVFELFGHPDVRLLDGGRDAWMGEERDTSFAVPETAATDYPIVEREEGRIRTFVDTLRREVPAQLIDARLPADFAGTDPELTTLRSGHIPGAVNVAWGSATYPNSLLKSRAELEHVYGGFDPALPVTTYCNLGSAAALTWYVLRYALGFEQASLYDGSWAEWGNLVGVPVERAAR
ncbi:sulfurtransferase [Corynebacterium liangguodongii]|uniref:Sulfurtransferase n=1 Tax=Corynebacterium liangguodongii TaxID=2079535 RepID=A0A2S0WCN2_9CORY|nr:sulfurtransferase [Corynebacterium liangguodongii]AWB83504.1 sulfurtransferase [Corynebacterium liangguodongii]PWC00407.1 sulfurtransferase [Corynebacterium liangguodongii]